MTLGQNGVLSFWGYYGQYGYFFTEKLRLFAHVVGNLSHKGIARRALPASGGKNAEGGGGNKNVNKGE